MATLVALQKTLYAAEENPTEEVEQSIWAPSLKMTRETPEVRSDIRKPTEDRQNHRYNRYC